MAASNRSPRKTFVLVHGAFHGGWCWSDVSTRLSELGHTVYRPTNTGLGERSHLIDFNPSLETFIQDIVNAIRYEDLEDVFLVGHSFAGPVISGVADRIPERLRHLVFLDAGLLESGQSQSDLLSAEALEAYKLRLIKLNSGVIVLPPGNPVAFGITDPQKAAWMAGKLTPHPFRTYFDKLELKHKLGNGLPATYIACSNPYFANIARARELAKGQRDWRYLEIPTAHNAMMLMPQELTEMLVELG